MAPCTFDPVLVVRPMREPQIGLDFLPDQGREADEYQCDDRQPGNQGCGPQKRTWVSKNGVLFLSNWPIGPSRSVERPL